MGVAVNKSDFVRDYYYDSYYAAAVASRLVPPPKRPRLMVPQTRSVAKNAMTTMSTTSQQKGFPAQASNGTVASSATTVVSPSPADQLKIYSNPDILICGNCREMFTDLQELLDHKKSYCKLRFTCKCNTINGVKSPGNRKDAASLLCVQCKDSFQSAWDLMVHVQAAHMINIYELGVGKCPNGTHSSPSASPPHKNDGDDDALCDLPESPDFDKNKDNDLELVDAMDIEGSDCGLNHTDVPSIQKQINGDSE